MKKLFLLFLVMGAVSFTANAQDIPDHAIGIRISSDSDGVGPEVNYQHRLTDSNRLEVGFGWHGGSWHNNVKLTGVYQWVWEIDNGFNWFAGPGAGLGIENKKYGKRPYQEKDSNFFGYATGTIGIEYHFDFPLMLSFDFRPQLNFGYSDAISYDFGLGARYVF